MLTRELAVIGCAAPIVILRRMLKVCLGRNSFAPGIAVITNLVEDIFKFIFDIFVKLDGIYIFGILFPT